MKHQQLIDTIMDNDKNIRFATICNMVGNIEVTGQSEGIEKFLTPEKTKRYAVKVLKEVQEREESAGKDPMGLAATAIAEAVSSFSAVGITGDDEIHAVVVSSNTIEETEAYGYGIISSEGLDAILVTTTHGGLQDSAAQTDASDASFHNHYVALTVDDEDDKCPGAEIVDISFDEPGDVTIIDNVAVISGPTEFESTHSLTGEKVEFKTDGTVGAVVSFTIDPVDADGITITDVADLAAVCINDVTSAS